MALYFYNPYATSWHCFTMLFSDYLMASRQCYNKPSVLRASWYKSALETLPAWNIDSFKLHVQMAENCATLRLMQLLKKSIAYKSYLCYNTFLRDEQTLYHQHTRNYSLYCVNKTDFKNIENLSNVESKHLLMNMTENNRRASSSTVCFVVKCS
jgi:hypothetical protein